MARSCPLRAIIEEKSTLKAMIEAAEAEEFEAAEKVRVADANMQSKRQEPGV
jgi:hypothetical protein